MRERVQGSGVWELRVYVGRDPVTNRPKQVSRTFRGSKRGAQSAVAKLITEVEEGTHGGTRATMGYLFDRWLEHVERIGRAVNTVDGYTSAVNIHLRPGLGRLKVANVTAGDIDALYAAMQARGAGVATIRHVHAALSTALTQAVKWGWIRTNPAQMASPPPEQRKDIRPPTPDEMRMLIAEAEKRNPDIAAMLALAALTGARRGELCGLQWADLDLDGRTLTIQRAVAQTKGRVFVKGTKTGRVRKIALDDVALAVLATHRAQVEERARGGEATVATDGYVFSPRLDARTPYKPWDITGLFGRIRTAAGLKHIDLHHVRHFTATQLVASGMDVRTIAGRLGHANAAITLRVYSHFLEAADRSAAEHMGRVLQPAPAPSD